MGKLWTEGEARAWMPPRKTGLLAWAEAHRTLPPQLSAEPGQLRWDRTPYFRGIADAVMDAAVQQVVFLKPTQVGFSEFCRTVLGWWIDEEPGPCLWVTPNETSARENIDERIVPMIESTPAVARHLSPDPDDNTKSVVRFDSMTLYTGWAGSPQALATRPCRYVIADEVDKYPSYSGREADPISLATERTATFGYRRKIILGSTPTLRTGNIWRAFEGCDDQRCYFLPCPHCSHYQRLVWTNLDFSAITTKDKAKRAAEIELTNAAVYRCEQCRGAMTESPAMS